MQSERAINTAGPAAAVAYHAFLENRDSRLGGLPNADQFVKLAEAISPETQHLELHAGHLTQLNSIDQQIVTGDALAITPLTCHGAELPGRLERLAEQGITDVAFQPMGDIDRELRAFAAAARI